MNTITYRNILSLPDQEYAFNQIIKELEKYKQTDPSLDSISFSTENTAKLIKKIGKGYSSRFIAELAFTSEDPRFGNSIDGRDVKRWAAEILGELEEACGSWAN